MQLEAPKFNYESWCKKTFGVQNDEHNLGRKVNVSKYNPKNESKERCRYTEGANQE